MADKKKVILYTDGACSGNPGPGGWGAVLMYGDYKKEMSGGDPDTTNNRMELMAAIEGLNALKMPCIVELYTDSAYLHNAFSNGWINSWVKNGWKKADKKPVLNIDLWQELIRLNGIHIIHWHKVKGHADNEYNNRCDELARAAIDEVRSDIPCDEECRISLSHQFQNGIGCWYSVISGSQQDELQGTGENEYKMIVTALIKSLSALTKSSIVGLYVSSGRIADVITDLKPDTDIAKRLSELMQAHDVRIHKLESPDEDAAYLRCHKRSSDIFSSIIEQRAKSKGKLFVKLYIAAEAGEKCGAWYSIITDGKVKRSMEGKYYSATQNYLRLSAITESIESLTRPCIIEIHTDSMYLYETATERLDTWRKNEWLKANQQSVAHAELWQIICNLRLIHELYWFKHEKGSQEPHMLDCASNVQELIN